MPSSVRRYSSLMVMSDLMGSSVPSDWPPGMSASGMIQSLQTPSGAMSPSTTSHARAPSYSRQDEQTMPSNGDSAT